MGAYLKYIIPVIALSIGLLAFQNCGQKLQANGDPYENPSIQLDDGFIDPPSDTGPVDGQAQHPGFISEAECTADLAGGQIFAMKLGKKHGNDAALVILADGRNKSYLWPASEETIAVNDFIIPTVEIVSFRLSGAQIQVQIVANGSAIQENFTCQ